MSENKNDAIFIQARFNSSRFPGKVLSKVSTEYSLLELLVKRIRSNPLLPKIIVLTSTEATDNLIAEECRRLNVECFRGDLNNVAKRFYDGICKYQPARFARVCADSPLYFPELLEQGFSKSADIVSNVLKRTFPKGTAVEIIKSSFFLDNYKNLVTNADKEHVTKYFYENSTKFDIASIENEHGDESSYNLCVDTPEDMQRIKNILLKLKKDPVYVTLEDLRGVGFGG
jgi:spore coat polysaccharide biosynthesis protein SpsF